jgi:hypothetical protein
MSTENRTLVLVPGENLRRGQGHDYLMGKTRRMGPSAKINAIAGFITARDLGSNAHILTSAGDAAELGITEAEQNMQYILAKNRKGDKSLKDRIFTETQSYDSFTISRNASDFIETNRIQGEGFNRAVLVDIVSHRRRMSGQMKAWGVPLDDSLNAESVYVNDKKATKSTKRRRQRVVDRIHRGVVSIHPTKPYDIFEAKSRKRKGIISWQMLAERTGEFVLNVIGKVDNKGYIVNKLLTSKSRKNA